MHTPNNSGKTQDHALGVYTNKQLKIDDSRVGLGISLWSKTNTEAEQNCQLGALLHAHNALHPKTKYEGRMAGELV